MGDTLRQSRSPLYLQISEILRQILGQGCWKPGDLLPTISDLAAEYKAAKNTIRQAVKIIKEDELLEDRDADVPGEPLIGDLSDNGYHLLRRTHARDGQCYCVISIYFEKDLFSRHEAELPTQLALPVLVDSPDIDVARARQSFANGKCNYEVAGLLGLIIGDPVVYARRVVYLADVTYHSDYVRLEMDLLA